MGSRSADRGRPGMQYWSILVLGAVRLGCNLNYDRLQNLAEEHRSLRLIMGIGGWCDEPKFDWRCLRDNIALLSPDTIERLNHLIVAEGHRLVPEAAETVRGDSFVVATDIHYPTDSGLIGDGLRTIVRDGAAPGGPPGGGRLASAQAPAPRREEAPPRHQPDRRGQGPRLPEAASGRLPRPLRRVRSDHRPGDGVARSRPDLHRSRPCGEPRSRGSGPSYSTS